MSTPRRKRRVAQTWITVNGAIGTFDAPGATSPVTYLMTHASLAGDGTGASQLTKQLRPVREVFEVDNLDFRELIQRDLDDHRVATDIIPYLLRSGDKARFFPPILAMVLPYSRQRIVERYPDLVVGRELEEDGTQKVTESFGNVFQFVRYEVPDTGELIRDGSLKLNPDQCRLAVIDGQHRAMALLAIDRCMSGEWEKGSEFREFYDGVVEGYEELLTEKQLRSIELPVCLVFLPGLAANGAASSGHDILRACRSLFLDVNKAARRPTRSRTLLLDDSSLLSVLAGSLLSEARRGNNLGLTLDVIEYDSPFDDPKPRRDFALCTNEMLYEMVRWTTFEDDGYYSNLSKKPNTSGRWAVSKDRFFEQSMASRLVKTAEISEWGLSTLEGLDPGEIPPAARDKLTSLFLGSWGSHILHVLAKLRPFSAHAEAVAAIKERYRKETEHGLVAWKALFDGQGVYWTVKSHAEDRARQRRESGVELEPTRVETAYELINSDWLPEFRRQRAASYLGLPEGGLSQADIEVVDRMYSRVFRTTAFQVGVLMAFAYLKNEKQLVDLKDSRVAVDSWIAAVNHAFVSKPKTGKSPGYRSLRLFDGKGDGMMGTYGQRLQKSRWHIMRYFVLEMMASVGDAHAFVGADEAAEAARQERVRFVDEHARRIVRQRKAEGIDLSLADAKPAALVAWGKALSRSLGISKKSFEEWRDQVFDSKKGSEAISESARAEEEVESEDTE